MQSTEYGADPITDVLNAVDAFAEVDADIDAALDVIDRLFDGDLTDGEVDELLAELDRLGF